MYYFVFFFFFSSRRRHTRCSRDWSSDVCSSDLIIRHYTHEAGVRNLEREIQNIARKMARKVVTDGADSSVEINAENVKDFLGVQKYREFWLEKQDRKSTRLNSSHGYISYAVFCLKKKK